MFQNRFLIMKALSTVQRVATIASVKLERKLGALTEVEMNRVLDALAERLGI